MADHSEELAAEMANGEHDDEYWWPDVPENDDDDDSTRCVPGGE